jgi:hypothetical protein
MAENKKSVLLYCDIIYTVEELDDVDAGLLFKHYLRYINDQNPEPPSKLVKIVFEPIKQTLKRDLKKWEETTNSRSKAGIAGAEARWQKVASDGKRIKPMAKMADSVNVIDNVIVKDKVNDRVKTLAEFENCFDEIWKEQMQMIHKGKDLGRAIQESYAHLTSDPLRFAVSEVSDYKKVVNSWLSNQKPNGTKERKVAFKIEDL